LNFTKPLNLNSTKPSNFKIYKPVKFQILQNRWISNFTKPLNFKFYKTVNFQNLICHPIDTESNAHQPQINCQRQFHVVHFIYTSIENEKYASMCTTNA